MEALTQTQTRVLKRLGRRWRDEGRQPNLSALADDLGMTYVSLRQHLEAAAKKGHLKFESQGRGKTPILQLGLETPRGVPLVGEITAGSLRGEVAHVEGYLELPGSPRHFALRVTGDSMADYIADGDVVLLVREPPRSGDICAVRYNDETTLKYLDLYADGSAVLRPHNPAYDPVDVRREEIDVAGRFDSLLRGPVVHLLFREPS